MTASPEYVDRFPNIAGFSREVRVEASALVRIFETESEYRRLLFEAQSYEARKSLYSSMYSAVHALLGGAASGADPGRYERRVRVFRRELSGASIVDVGCGSGNFLLAVSKLLPYVNLLGIDTSASCLPDSQPGRRLVFAQGDIVQPEIPWPVDVFWSDNVYEHLHPEDGRTHLRSLFNALRPGGTLILIAPNRLWGPSDVTRVIDGSYSGRVPAQGSHLNEPAYSDLLDLLSGIGYSRVRTVLPFALRLPVLGRFRPAPAMSCAVERNKWLRQAAQSLCIAGRTVFKNEVVLVCKKPA